MAQQGYYGGGQVQPVGQPMMYQPPTHNTTTVIMQQPQTNTVVQPRDWNTGLCSCFDDVGICLCVFFCAPCAACQLLGDLGESVCVCMCVPNWLNVVRSKVRAHLNIRGSICNDCCAVTYCGTCAMCQIMREVKEAKQQGKQFI